MRLTTKFYASILAVTVLALLSSALGLFTTWQMADHLGQMIRDDLPSAREAEKLESSLLKQSEYDESYILDEGNPRWLKALAYRKRLFWQCLETAKTTTHSPTEIDILARLENVYRKFDTKRDEVFALYDKGDAAKAKQVLLEELDPLSDGVINVCDEFIEYIEHYVDAATATEEIQIRRIMWIASAITGLTAFSGAGLLWLFISGVHAPLRKMVADAKFFAHASKSDTSSPPGDDFGAVGFYLRALMFDVTSVRSALEHSRRQAQNAEKLASVGKLAASVAHEIRNPLVAVNLWLTSIMKNRRDDPELSRDLGMISEEIVRLDGIVRDFLEFSRPQVLKLASVQIAPLLDETLELINCRSEESRINLSRKYTADLPSIMGDYKQLKQMFINLLNNAAEAMPNGGDIKINASSFMDSKARPMVVVRIQDTGPGVPEDVQNRLFEPFFTTKESGTGLGLCIAAGIMSRHGGRLVLESSNSQGTTFAVWIPAANDRSDPDSQLQLQSASQSNIQNHFQNQR